MVRILAGLMTAVSVIGLGIYSLSYQLEDTKQSLPDPSNASASWEALNVSTSISTDMTSVLAGGLPLLMGLILVAILGTLLLVVSGR